MKEIYFSYNDEKKHSCQQNIYEDFCCSAMFKRNKLFVEHPNSLQLQIFIDSFEVCDPLKTKANKHTQIGIYFAIRNMPPELAYNQENIHLIALCNVNNLKPSHVDYNDLWERIVQEIRVLETSGITLDNGDILRGSLQE